MSTRRRRWPLPWARPDECRCDACTGQRIHFWRAVTIDGLRIGLGLAGIAAITLLFAIVEG